MYDGKIVPKLQLYNWFEVVTADGPFSHKTSKLDVQACLYKIEF